MMLSSESMIINYTTNDIVQNSNTAGHKQSSTPTKAKVQKVQKKIRKESACSTTTKGTPKQQQQGQQLPKNKQVVSQLTSPSWSDKTVNLTSSSCSTALPSLTSKNSISSSGAASSVSLNGQCLANTPQQLHQQQNQQQQNLYQGSTKKKNQTKISPRSQTSSLTSEISSFDLYSYNDCVGSSTSSTNQGGIHHPSQQIRSNQNDNSNIQGKTINFSPLISPTQEPPHYQHIPLTQLDHISHSSSPKTTAYYQQNIGSHYHQQSSSQKNNVNNNMACNTNNSYNSGYPSSSPCMQNQYYSNNSNCFDNSTTINPAHLLTNWNVLPIEIQRATFDMNGKIEEVQMNYDSCVPFIQMPQDRNFAFQKVKEAQLLQEQLVFQIASVREGMTLLDAVDQLKGINKGDGASKGTSNIASGSQACQQTKNSTGAPSKQKKISKKANKQEKNGQLNGLQISPQKTTNGGNFSSSMVTQNISQVGQINGNRQNDNGAPYNAAFNGNNNNSYNYLPEEQEIQNKETENNTPATTFQHANHSTRAQMEYAETSVNNHHSTQGNNNQGMDAYPPHNSNKNGMMSPRKPALSMQGYDEEVMSQMNQYEDFPYQPKLRKYMSDPFGDYYYHHNSNYHGNQGHNYNNQSDNMDAPLSVIYEDENPYFNQQQQGNLMATNFKKDDDDTLYGYVSQNDTIEDLINSQSKCKTNKNSYYNNSNINNNFNSSGYLGSYMDDTNNGRVYTGSSRNAGMDSYYNSNNNNCQVYNNSSENLGGNTKQRTSSVATTDLHSSSQRKLDYEYNFEGNNHSFNKHY